MIAEDDLMVILSGHGCIDRKEEILDYLEGCGEYLAEVVESNKEWSDVRGVHLMEIEDLLMEEGFIEVRRSCLLKNWHEYSGLQ